jgi:oligopeptide/dipeptide ABC transporter ATP-binding protein
MSPVGTRATPKSPAQNGSGQAPVLSVSDLEVQLRLRKRTVYPLNGVDLEVRKGETVGLVGESGSGKSMLALAVMGLLPRPFGKVVAGSARLGETDLVGLSERRLRELRGERMSMVFQEPMTALDPLFTVGEQLVEAVRAHRGVSRAEARDLAIESLRGVGLPSPERRVDSYPHELSGGMRQRVVIAIALCLQPEVMLADEPTTALDVTVQAQILELIARAQQDLHMGVLLITHDLAVVSEVADRVAVMYAGRIVETAPAAALFAMPQHPYTHGLMKSTLDIAEPPRRLPVIPGKPPDLSAPPVGCPFAPRCPNATERCVAEAPPAFPRPGAPEHRFRCWHPVGGGVDGPA